MVRNIKLNNNKIVMEDEFEMLYEKKITKFGTGAKIDAPKDLIGKKVYVLVRKE